MLAVALPVCVHGADRVERRLLSITASPTGSELVAVLEDDHGDGTPTIYAVSPSSGKILWKRSDLPLAKNAVFSASGKLVGIAFSSLPQNDAVAELVDAVSGKVLQSVRQQDVQGYFPAETVELIFSPDDSILYGLGERFVYAWDIHAAKLLWTREVPGGSPSTQMDTATSFALSTDGSRLGLNRFGRVFLLNVGRTSLSGVTELPGSINNVSDQPAFSPDGHYFVTGYGYNSTFAGAAEHYTRGGLLWRLNGSKPVPVKNCGGYFAWTSNPEIFACQNYTGTHLRGIHNPGTDIGAAGPVSDLPMLKVGNSLWVAAYRETDWKDPAKALPLTLTELGTSRQVMITLPGRQ